MAARILDIKGLKDLTMRKYYYDSNNPELSLTCDKHVVLYRFKQCEMFQVLYIAVYSVHM